jgi:hypothetical protein
MVVAATLANGSLTLGSLNFPNVALEPGGEGIGDTWVRCVSPVAAMCVAFNATCFAQQESVTLESVK